MSEKLHFKQLRENLWKSYEENLQYIYIDSYIHDMDGKDYIRHLFFVTTDEIEFDDFEGDGGIWLSLEDAQTKKYTTDVTKEFQAILPVIKNILL